ncbi:MAG TPA: hypothetical protein VH120_17040 [Gemmataceae bacterium]|jgi:hypothetical protein|nr:hypothetical protein [Gemmataceae bacterium]
MDTTENKTTGIPPEILAEINKAIENAMHGVRDREAMRLACERMDRTREAIARRNGVLDFAVPTIRALRDGEDDA